MRLKYAGAVLFIFLALTVTATVWAQGNTGAISGRVVDDKNEPIPGAVISVTSKFLQGARGSATGVNGDYVIPYLPPGNDYKITIEAAGFNKVIQSNVTVSLGSTTTLETGLTGGGTELSITARPPVITLKESKLQVNLTQEELETLPVARSYQSTLYLAPTVVSSGEGSGNPGVAGSSGSENVFIINGINTTDPVTGTFGTNLNYNFIREMEVSTGGFEAEFGSSTGGLFNVLTKSGTNEYHGEVFAYYTDQSFAANNHSTDFTITRPQPYHSYDYGFGVGGPIMKDRLWFYAGLNPSLSSRHYEGTYTVTNIFTGDQLHLPYNYDDLSRNWFWSGKLNWRVSDKHNLELALFGDPSHMWFNEGALPYLDKQALMTRRYQGGFSAALKWYASWNSKLFSEVGVGKTHSILQITPWTHEGFGTPAIGSFNWSPTLALNGGSGTIYYDDRYNTQFDAKASYIAGRHEIKAGGNLEDLKWDDYSGYTGGANYYVYINKAGTDPLSPNLNDYKYYYRYTLQNPQANEKGRYTALFLQDKWAITDYINLSVGVRWEKNEAQPNRGTSLALSSWSPRVGFSWDWAKNGKSKFYMNWGQYNERMPIAMTSSMDPGHASYTDIFRLGQPYRHYAYGTVATIPLSGAKSQFTSEFIVGAQYELQQDLTIGLRTQFRSLDRVLEDVGYVDGNGDISYIIMNPGTDQWPSYMNRWQGVIPGYQRFPKPIRNYQAYTFTANKRFSNQWFLNASYTWSQLRGNYEGTGGYILGGNPNVSPTYDIPSYYNIHNYYGLLGGDRTHSVKVQGSYRFDMGLVLGSSLSLQSGRPMNKLMDWPRNEVGYGTIYVVPQGSAGRMPTTWTLDVHAEYAFKMWKTEMAFFADVFNVTNNQSQTGYYSTYYRTPETWTDYTSGSVQLDPNWGKTSGRQGSRYARIGAKWSF